MYRLNFEKRAWIVKQKIKGKLTSKIALSQGISRMTVSNVIKVYKEQGWGGLKDHKTGRPETQLNKNTEVIIFDLRKRYKYGACKIEELLKQKGFSISHRQIHKLLLRNGLVEPNTKKQKPRKWVRFQLPSPNDMWHTDWTTDPFTEKKLSAYIDDRTRFITSYGLFGSSTAENSIALLKTGIAYYGKPKSVMTDHGSQYYASKGDVTKQNTQFRIVLDVLGIKHYVARVNRPQTNGKIERWFWTYKSEYLQSSFKNIKDFVKWYNEERPHMSLGYKTPKDVWDELKNRD